MYSRYIFFKLGPIQYTYMDTCHNMVPMQCDLRNYILQFKKITCAAKASLDLTTTTDLSIIGCNIQQYIHNIAYYLHSHSDFPDI